MTDRKCHPAASRLRRSPRLAVHPTRPWRQSGARRCGVWLGLAIHLVLTFGFTAGASAQVTEAQIDQAIETLRQTLYRLQDERTGGWFGTHDASPAFDNPKHDGGLSVLATYALLASGEQPELNPDLAKALEYVEKLQREHWEQVDGTYVVAVRNHIWPLLPRELYASSLERDTKRLLRGASRVGTFSYWLSTPPNPFDSRRELVPRDLKTPQERPNVNWYDHSATQYGVLGLWEAAKLGVRIPDRFWEAAANHFIATQWPNGGWSYTPDREPSKAMTCAGLTVLCIAQQQLGRGDKKPDARLQAAIEKGLAYLDEVFAEDKNVYSGSGYYIYSVERVGLATGRSRFGKLNPDGSGGSDWYDNFAEYIVKKVRRPSDSVHNQVVNSSFFLMFLSRGRVPVFINKLALEDIQDWNNRPNDIYFLAKYLSDTFEQELNWKVIPINWRLERWLGAPLTYLSIDEPFELTDAQADTIKRYLDLGGLLVVNPEGDTSRILKSVDQLAQELYPGRKLEPVADDHPVLSLWRPTRGKPRPVFALHNGVRDVILMPQSDWGFDWQRGGEAADDAYALGGNLFLYATGYRRLEGRAALRYPAEPDNPRGPEVVVAVAGPGAALEPALWEYLRRQWAAAAVARLRVVQQPLEQVGEPVDVDGRRVKPDLVHLVGVDALPPMGDALSKLQRYVAEGGTALVETLGGRGDFTRSVETQLASGFGGPPERLSRYEPMFSDSGRKGAGDVSRVTYRNFSVRNFGTDNKPRLSAFRVGDRPAVILSAEDLSMAAMGVRHWGLHGYSDESARQLLANIVINAKR